MEFLVLIFFVVGLSFFLAKVFDLLHLPRVLAPIFVGIVFNLYFRDFVLVNFGVLESFSNLGIVMLLFYIGLELNLKDAKKQKDETFYVAFFGFLIAFFLGFCVSFFALEFGFISSFVIGAVLSVTAESVVVLLLEEAHLLKTKVGEIIVGAGIIDDVFGIFFLMIISILGIGSFDVFSVVPLVLGVCVFFLGYFFLGRVSRFVDYIFAKKNLVTDYDLFTYSILFLLFFAIFSNWAGFDFSLGAILAGVLLNFSLNREGQFGVLEEHKINHFVKNMTFGFLYYFFFFWVGLNFDFSFVFGNLYLGLCLAFVAFFCKYFAGLFAALVRGDTFSNGSLIGIGMTSKGGVELIIAEIARKGGLIGNDAFSALVFMSLLLTVVSPIVFNFYTRKRRKVNGVVDEYFRRKGKGRKSLRKTKSLKMRKVKS